MVHAISLQGPHTTGGEGQSGSGGADGRCRAHHGSTFMKTTATFWLSHIFSKYFLSFSNVPATVPGTRVMPICMMTPLLECDSWKGEMEIMEERSN